jgi:hypothetical protein
MGSNPISVSYIDTDSSNNGACVKINLKSGTTSTQELTKDININVFPNPASNQISFELTAASNEDVIATVIDVTGRIMLTKSLGKGIAGAKNNYSLDISSLNNGNYLLKVSNSNNVYNATITVKN